MNKSKLAALSEAAQGFEDICDNIADTEMSAQVNLAIERAYNEIGLLRKEIRRATGTLYSFEK